MNRVLLRYELLGLLRDTRTLVLSVLLPIILLPVLLYTLQGLGQQRWAGSGNEDYRYAPSKTPDGLKVFSRAVFGSDPYQERLGKDPESMLDQGSLDFAIRSKAPEKLNSKLAVDLKKIFPSISALVDAETPGRPVIEILYRSDRDRSMRSFFSARETLEQFREQTLFLYFYAKGAENLGVRLETRDVSTVQERAARKYGPALSTFMVLILLGGGSVAALDSLAGERDRGTLVTLFLSSLPRAEILWSKFVAVAVISVGIALVQMVNLSVYVLLGWVKMPMQLGWVQGFGMLSCLSVLFLGEAVFTAALLLYISARSGSFKEAQLFFFPAFLISFALSLSGLLPGLPSRSIVSLVPLAGPGLLIPEILANRAEWPILLLQVCVHLGFAYMLIRSTLTYIDREEFLGGQPPTVGRALRFHQFSQRALPFFALLGAALMVVPANFAFLSTLRGQAVFNQLVLFGLGPYLLLRYFGQPFRKVVPIKRVSWPILVACLALIPLGQVAATGLSHLLGPLLPAPVKALEEMMKLLDLENTPAWQLYLMIGILPGFCEEFAFRGVLLHALHRRFPPWVLAAVVALVFGLFHLSFYRVFPTAYLGFFLGILTLSTGSLVPAILVHAGNNSLAVYAMLHGWDFESLSPWVYFVGFLGQIVLTYFVYRWGRGYPGTSWATEASR